MYDVAPWLIICKLVNIRNTCNHAAIDSNLNCHRHCASVVSKANQCLVVIRKSFSSLDAHIPYYYISQSFDQLEYDIWDPQFKLDQQALEKLSSGLQSLLLLDMTTHAYEDILHILSLPLLYYWWKIGNMIEAYSKESKHW